MKTIKSLKMFAAGAVTALALSACDGDVFNINTDPFKNQTYTNVLNSPISVYLEGEEDFSEYAKALRYSDTYNALNQSTSGVSFTAFAPNNDAMADFYQRRGVESLEELSQDYVRSFVLYHTVPDSITTDKFVTKTSVTNLSGDIITIAIDSLNAGQATLNGIGQVYEMGISAYNGKVYALSKAMTPLVETVYDRVVDAGNSQIMVDALRATGWDKELSIIADTVVISGMKTVTKRYYTLLNVTDATFAKANIQNLDGLKATLLASDDRGLSVDSLLNEYVSYHIIGNMYKTSDFESQGSMTTRIMNSTAKNQVLAVTTDTLATSVADRYIFNEAGESAKFVESASDVEAKNGYVHELTAWLPVWEPEQSVVIWDLADYAEIKNIVDAEDYQPEEPATTEARTRVARAECFEIEMGEGGTSNTSYSDVDYVTSKSYSVTHADKTKEVTTANNNDRIVFNVGYMGSVKMTTPTLVKGKYRVELKICYLTSHSFMKNQTAGNGGLMRMGFDDREDATVYVSPYTKVDTAYPGFYSSVIFDEVEFTETAAHDFKFVVMDPAASSNKNFSLQFDCITFTPID